MRARETDCSGPTELGDALRDVLQHLGVTRLVSRWVENCGCDERRERLNELDRWFRWTMRNKFNDSLNRLVYMINLMN